MAKKTSPMAAMLEGAVTPAQVRAAKIDAKSDEQLDALLNRGTGPAPKSKAAKLATEESPAPAAPAQPAPEPAPQAAPQPVEMVEPAPAPGPKPRNKGGRPEEYEDLQQISMYIPGEMIDKMDRIVFERKLAGDKKFNRSWFMREALAAALSKE